jgi:hypothetical protein
LSATSLLKEENSIDKQIVYEITGTKVYEGELFENADEGLG